MKKQIVRVSVVQTAKFAACAYFVMSLPLLLIMMMAAPLLPFGKVGLGMVLLLPVLYALLAFLMAVIGGGLYNLVARFVGGIEFVTKDVDVGTTSY
jgi:hypothetical protein